MKKLIVLLTGNPGIGKTTIIHKVVRKLIIPVAGFFTQELRENDMRVGFEIITLAGKRATMAHIEFSKQHRVGKYGVNLAAIDELATSSIIHGVENQSLIVIDEIGPMEILSTRFRYAVISAIKSASPILGTIAKRRLPFIDKVKSLDIIQQIEVNRSNRDKLSEVILEIFNSSDFL